MALESELDEGAGAAARIGVVVLETDETLEAEFRTLFADPEIALYHSRIPMQQAVTVDGLKAMEAALPDAFGLLPNTAPLNAAGFACTSAATLIGRARVAEIARAHHGEARITDPISAAIAAFSALGVGRIGLVTPYLIEICQAMIHLFEENGIAVTGFGSFERSLDFEVARITPQSILDAALEIGSAQDVDAVFISCTNLRALPVLPQAEARLGKPVVSSNQAFAWHLAEQAGIAHRLPPLGRLLTPEQPADLAAGLTAAIA
jgi:maleate isomerase